MNGADSFDFTQISDVSQIKSEAGSGRVTPQIPVTQLQQYPLPSNFHRNVVELKNLQSEMNACLKVNEKYKSMVSQLNLELQNTAKMFEERYTDQKNELEVVNNENLELRDLLDKVKNRLVELDNDNNDLKNEIDKNFIINQQKDQEYSNLLVKYNMFQKENDELSNCCNSLEESLNEMNNNKINYEKEINELKESIQKTSIENSKIILEKNKEIGGLVTTFNEMKSESEKLNNEVLNLREEFKLLHTNYRNMESECSKLRIENESLKKSETNMKKELEKKENTINEMKIKYEGGLASKDSIVREQQMELAKLHKIIADLTFETYKLVGSSEENPMLTNNPNISSSINHSSQYSFVSTNQY